MLLEQRCIRGVVKRTQHAGNILQRRPLLASLLKRSCRLAFEINNDKVAAGEQDLAEMIIAVDARDHGRDLEPGEELKAAAGNFFKFEYAVCILPGVVRHSVA